MHFLDEDFEKYCSSRTIRSVEKSSLEFPETPGSDGPARETMRVATLICAEQAEQGGLDKLAAELRTLSAQRLDSLK